jgi:thioesterase domain-containing protein
MVMRLISEVRQTFHVQLTIADVFEHPTLGQLAKLIETSFEKDVLEAEQEPIFTSVQRRFGNTVVKLNESTATQNVFCFHAGAGSAFVYRAIAGGCKEIATFYGFQPPHIHMNHRVKNMRDLCDVYVRCILELQQEGPYYLLGFSMGGTIAYEVAQQLKDSGKDVANITQLDNPYLSWVKDNSDKAWYFPIKRAFTGYLDLHLDFDWLKLDGLGEDEGILLIERELIAAGVSVEGVSRQEFVPYMHYFCDMYWMYGSYICKNSDFNIDVYIAEEKVEQSKHCSEFLDWENATTGQLTTTEIGGNHVTMLVEPHLSDLVVKIRTRLKKVLQNG